jgi:hypothetical protein
MKTKALKSIIKEVIKELNASQSKRFIFDVSQDQWIKVIQPSIAKNTAWKGSTDIQVSQQPKSIVASNPNTIQAIETVLQGLGLVKTADDGKNSLWKVS